MENFKQKMNVYRQEVAAWVKNHKKASVAIAIAIVVVIIVGITVVVQDCNQKRNYPEIGIYKYSLETTNYEYTGTLEKKKYSIILELKENYKFTFTYKVTSPWGFETYRDTKSEGTYEKSG